MSSSLSAASPKVIHSAQKNPDEIPTNPPYDGNHAATVAPENPETALLAIFAQYPDAAKKVCSGKRNGLARPDFQDEYAGGLFGAFALCADDGNLTAPNVRATLDSIGANNSDQADVMAGARLLHDSIGAALPDGVTALNAARIALDLAQRIKLESPTPKPKTKPATKSTPEKTATARQRFELFSFKDLAKLPRPEWLVRGLLVEKTTSVISADSGHYKSFFALEMALCVALGRPFHDREVKQGAAVYVAAEGFYTMFERAAAFAQFHECELPENFHILKVPVNVSHAATVAEFAECIASLSPALVVLDTLSQNAVGANENDNGQMADFVRGMMALGHEIGAHVQVLHHNAKSTGAFRGAGSIKANVDAHISLDRPEGDEENTVFVRCEKQRGRPFEAFALRGLEVELPIADEYGDPITSLVFEPCGDAVAPKAEKHPNAKKADKTSAALLEIFDQAAIEGAEFGGVKVGFWKEKVEEADPPICSESAFWRHRKTLEKSGAIEECGSHNGSPLFRRKGSTVTTVTTANDSSDSRPIHEAVEYSHNCHNPLGVTVVRVATAIGGDSSTLPEMPTPKAKKKTNAQADSEAYAATGEGEVF